MRYAVLLLLVAPLAAAEPMAQPTEDQKKALKAHLDALEPKLTRDEFVKKYITDQKDESLRATPVLVCRQVDFYRYEVPRLDESRIKATLDYWRGRCVSADWVMADVEGERGYEKLLKEWRERFGPAEERIRGPGTFLGPEGAGRGVVWDVVPDGVSSERVFIAATYFLKRAVTIGRWVHQDNDHNAWRARFPYTRD